MAEDPYERYRSGTFQHLIWKLERGQFISPEDLADALEQDRGKAIPDEVLNCLVQTLRGEIKTPGGRPAKNDPAIVRELFACSCYESYLTWLQKRQARFGLTGWSCIRDADWWQGPPHERAAKMVVRWGRRGKWNISDKYIRNLVSSYKSYRG
jgi:hypothetical protein